MLIALLGGTTVEAKPLARVKKPIRDRYIALLVPTANPNEVAQDLGRAHGVGIGAIWEHALKGFSFTVKNRGEKVANALADDPRVIVVEEVSEIELNISAVQDFYSSYDGGLWGLDHIDEYTWPFRYPYTGMEDGTYEYLTSGSGVPIYVVDTGVRRDHAEFSGRVSAGSNHTIEPNIERANQRWDPWPADDPCGMISGGAIDHVASGCINTGQCYNCGHGTAVASIAGGASWGVAKGVTIVPVKVISRDAGGTTESLISGLNWIAQTHPSGAKGVVNMSVFYIAAFPGLDCGVTNVTDAQAQAIETAVNSLYNSGLVVVTSANSQNFDARCTVPARVANAITVGGAARDNTRMNIPTLGIASNFGPALDLWAPAIDIASAHISDPYARRWVSISGTSFASPFVAGCAARLFGASSGATSSTISSSVITAGLTNVMSGDLGAGSTNRYLYCSPNW